jgi:hypothetical protein
MPVIGSRMRNQPPPPHVVFAALADPDRDPNRPWLVLLPDEQRPLVVRADEPHSLVWSSLWPRRPDATLQFDLARSADGSTDLRWTLYVEDPAPDESLTGHVRSVTPTGT